MVIEHGVAIGITILQLSHGDRTGTTGHIGHNNRLTKQLGQGGRDGTDSGISVSTRASGDQDFDCLLGVISEGNCGGAEHQHDKDHCDEDLEVFHGYAPSEKIFQ